MNKITTYFQEAYDELMHKVTWPTWAELQSSSVVVLATALIMSLVILAADISFKTALTQIYKMIIN